MMTLPASNPLLTMGIWLPILAGYLGPQIDLTPISKHLNLTTSTTVYNTMNTDDSRNATKSFSMTAETTVVNSPSQASGTNSPEIGVFPNSLTTTIAVNDSRDLLFSVENSPTADLPLTWALDTAGTSNQTHEVFYQQLQTGQFNGIISGVFVDGISDPGAYATDDFTVSNTIEIDGFDFDGFMTNPVPFPFADIPAFTVKVYADDQGRPSGHPEDGLSTELFSATIPTNNRSFELTNPNDPQEGVRLNVSQFTGSGWELTAGTYWVTVFAELNGPDRWAWMTGLPNNNLLPLFIDPQDFFELGLTTWTDLVTVTQGNADYSGLAFKVQSFLDCGASWLDFDATSGSLPTGDNQVITATIDTTGLSPGNYQTAICVLSNDPIHPLSVVPVNLTVAGENDLIFLHGFE